MEPTTDHSPLRLVKAILFTFAGVFLVVSALFEVHDTRQFVKAAATAPGEVIRLNAGGAHPQIRFVTAEGKTVEYPQGGLIWGYRVGDRVRVLYDPRSSALDPKLDTKGALWGFSLASFGLGAAFTTVATLLWRRPDLVR